MIIEYEDNISKEASWKIELNKEGGYSYTGACGGMCQCQQETTGQSIRCLYFVIIVCNNNQQQKEIFLFKTNMFIF